MSESFTLTRLVEQTQAGDAASYDLLVVQFQPFAVAYALGLTGSLSDAEDVAQEAFLAAWLQIGSLHEPAAFPGWLRQIVFKHADRVRRRRRVHVALDMAAHLPDRAADPGVVLLRREQQSAVHTALQQLPPGERAAALLYYAGGCKQSEVADFLTISPAAVKKRLERGRVRLKGAFAAMSIVENQVADALQGATPSQRTRFVEVNRLLRDLTAQLDADPQVAAAYLARWGSDEGLGAQNDAWASLNLHVVVRDEYLRHVAGGRREYASRVREPLLWVEGPQNAPPGGAYLMALYDGEAGPYEVDWYFRPLSLNHALPEQTIVLVNKRPLAENGEPLAGGFNGTSPMYANVPPPLQSDQELEQERERDETRNRISLFWAMWLISARYVARNPHEESMGFVPMLRDLLRGVREGLGQSPATSDNGGPQPTPGEKIALLRRLADDMGGLHPLAVAQDILVPGAIVPRAHRFLGLVEGEVTGNG